MSLKHSNLATTTLTANVASTDLAINIASAALFPTMAAGDYFFAALVNAANAIEFVKVTGITGVVVTIPAGGRGLGGTAAQNWLTGDRFELHVIDQTLFALQQEAVGGYPAAGTDTYTATLVPGPLGYVTYMTYFLHFANTNTSTTPTINLNGIGAITIVQTDGTALVPGMLPKDAMLRYDGTNMVLMNPANPGYKNIPQNVQSGNYTLVANDLGKHILSSNVGATTWTIPLNATVPFPVGAAITLVNDGTTAISIAITGGVTLKQAGTANTGARTLGTVGLATLLKVNTDEWFISGVGLT